MRRNTDGDVPNRDSVLGQGFWLDPVDRKRRLPDEAMWPPELDERPSEGCARAHAGVTAGGGATKPSLMKREK